MVLFSSCYGYQSNDIISHFIQISSEHTYNLCGGVCFCDIIPSWYIWYESTVNYVVPILLIVALSFALHGAYFNAETSSKAEFSVVSISDDDYSICSHLGNNFISPNITHFTCVPPIILPYAKLITLPDAKKKLRVLLIYKNNYRGVAPRTIEQPFRRMALNKRILAAACAGLMAIACILYIISNALPAWSVVKINLENAESRKTSNGLWRSCSTSDAGIQICLDPSSLCPLAEGEAASSCHKMAAAKTFITLACIFSAISALCLVACIIESINKNTIVVTLIKVLPILSLVVGIIGLAVGISYATYIGSLPAEVSLGAASILAIIAVVINLIAAISALLIR
ncbi:unnamed protein product [Adineta ricciae]|uniref:Uncharacterized protein n=1 Tax=Adineta ricciae TaxID=249248 RepID=A0A815WC49_ADIRI|nr:unnamed protein product [Adineta ricciae]